MLSSSSADASDGDTISTDHSITLNPNEYNDDSSSSPSSPKSSSSASSSSSFPFSLSISLTSSTKNPKSKPPKKMDDVWRDLPLDLGLGSSVSGNNVTSTRVGLTFNNETTLSLRHRSIPNFCLSMQDFLGTFSRGPSPCSNPPSNVVFSLFASPIFVSPSPLPSNVERNNPSENNVNTLTQTHSLHAALASGDPLPQEANSGSLAAASPQAFNSAPRLPDQQALVVPTGLGGSNSRAPKWLRNCKKPPNNSTERRERRMMMNRESAARSRARRRAYNADLEREIAILTEENERLRRQANLMRLIAIAAELLQKPPLRRSSTPPF